MSPHTALDGQIPNGIWYNKKSDVSSLRVFGFRAWFVLPQDQRSKLEPKALPLTTPVGYDHKAKAYRLFNPKTNQIHLGTKCQFHRRSVPGLSIGTNPTNESHQSDQTIDVLTLN